MSEQSEPDVNIGSGASTISFETDGADTRAEAVVDRLGQEYWTKTYGRQDAFECLVRTILSQNTSDVASQPAHDELIDRYGAGGPDAVEGDDGESDLAASLAAADRDELAETIASAGLYNRKAEVIQQVAEHVLAEYGSAEAFDEFVSEQPQETVRETLLDLHGVGPKTADCVLLFAGGEAGVFPVDTHVHRVYRRIGIASQDASHEDVRAILEDEVPAAKCGFGHTATIQFGREYCTARNPACLDGPEACLLFDLCDRVGVESDTEAQ
jgi:endonuclease-3